MEPHSTDAPISNRLRRDARGRAIPRSDAERAAQRQALDALIADWEAAPDDPPGETEAFMRAIDEGRPDRPLFEGYY